MPEKIKFRDADLKDFELVLKVMPMPKDCNAAGHIFGGWVMSQTDLAGSILPARLCHGRVVTIAVQNFIFREPVHTSDLLSFYAKILRVGNTSVTVCVDIFAQARSHSIDDGIKVAEATLTYVSLDQHGRPSPLPKLISAPETKAE